MLFKWSAFFPILVLDILAGLVCLVTGIVTIAGEVPARVDECRPQVSGPRLPIEYPTRTATGVALIRPDIAFGFALRTLNPIARLECALIRSVALLAAHHMAAATVRELYRVAGSTATGARRDWLGTRHKV
jgi:hypothetical protein